MSLRAFQISLLEALVGGVRFSGSIVLIGLREAVFVIRQYTHWERAKNFLSLIIFLCKSQVFEMIRDC